MKPNRTGSVALLFVVALVGAVVWLAYERLTEQSAGLGKRAAAKPVPVEVSPIGHGTMELKRTFSGTIEARAEFVVAPKVSGRIQKLYVKLADTVIRGQVVADLDNDEYLQVVAQAQADLEVAEANLGAAKSVVEIANRELARVKQLRDRGITTDTQFDVAKADQLAKQAEVEVAAANLRKADSLLAISRIRLGYTRVTADWSGGQAERIVAERLVDEGATVSANASLLRIVELDPVTAVVFVTEKDYANLHPGQQAVLTNDAYPGEQFQAQVERIAPVFREATRQARVELTVDNPESRLKPGMFIRATVALNRLENTTNVPAPSLTERDGQDGVFLVDNDGTSVTWRPVRVGVREGDRIQVQGEGLSGEVVTLGQQFLDDGSAILIAE